MTTNRNGTLNQRPLYGCTSCFEDYTWPASDLRVHDSECWCDTCWDERGWEFPDQPSWNDLEPYTPALQAERDALVEALECAHMALIGYLPGHRNDITGAAISRCEQALAAHPHNREGMMDE